MTGRAAEPICWPWALEGHRLPFTGLAVVLFLATALVVATAAQAKPASLSPGATYPAGIDPTDIVAADFTGDGASDIVFNSSPLPYGEGAVTLLPGNGDGTFGNPIELPVAGDARGLAAGDLVGNDTADLVVAASRGPVSIFQGGPALKLARTIDVSKKALSAVVGDFDGDGRNDLAIADYDGHAMTLLLRRAHGFKRRAVPTGLHVAGPVAADLNADGLDDLAFYRPGIDKYAAVVLNDGRAGFRTPRRTRVSQEIGTRSITALATAQLPGKKEPSLLVGSEGKLAVERVDAKGALVSRGLYRLGKSGLTVDMPGLSAADVTGGNADEVVALRPRALTILAGRPSRLATTKRVALPGRPQDVTGADFNRDGHQDLAVAIVGALSLGGPVVEILLNES